MAVAAAVVTGAIAVGTIAVGGASPAAARKAKDVYAIKVPVGDGYRDVSWPDLAPGACDTIVLYSDYSAVIDPTTDVVVVNSPKSQISVTPLIQHDIVYGTDIVANICNVTAVDQSPNGRYRWMVLR